MSLIDISTLSARDFDYHLPGHLIAQTPAEPRDASRLLVLQRSQATLEHRTFRDLVDYLRPGDLLVANRSQVIPARLNVRRAGGGESEILLLHRVGVGRWEALVRPGKHLPPGSSVTMDPQTRLDILERTEVGGRIVQVVTERGDPDAVLREHGVMPLPPYIRAWTGPSDRYQTVYADQPGSVAAPTAGLHFTDGLIDVIKSHGVDWATVTLHVGLDTFRPMKSDDVSEHVMHSEYVEVPASVVQKVRKTRARGGRVIAVGTTSVRALESAAAAPDNDHGWSGPTSLFILPGYSYAWVSGLITNFHLPKSTLLMLVSALAGRDRILEAYRVAVEMEYRFFSFGDAMLII